MSPDTEYTYLYTADKTFQNLLPFLKFTKKRKINEK